MSDAELCKCLEYIVGRGENLRLMTGRLRAALEAFFACFGSRMLCRLCDYEERAALHDRSMSVYQHDFKPRIQVDGVHRDAMPFYEKPDYEDEECYYKYTLIIEDLRLRVLKERTLGRGGETMKSWKLSVSDLDTPALKALVRSKRLAVFLEQVSNELGEEERETRELLELATLLKEVVA